MGIDAQIQVICHYDQLTPIKTDKTKVSQIYINLVKNAVLASPVAHKVLTFNIKKLENSIQIQAIDNGVGSKKKTSQKYLRITMLSRS